MSVPSPHAELLSEIPVSEHEATILGSSTRYWVYGPEHARDTVVLVHGYRGDHHGLEPVIARLPGIRIISPDLPGFGSSTPMTESDHSIGGYGRWLGAFVERLALPAPPVVLGHSFGSIVAAFAVADGLPVRALILVNPITTDPATARGIGITKLYYGAAHRLPVRAGEALLRNRAVIRGMSMTLAKTDDPVLRRWIHEEHARYFGGFSDRDTVVEGFAASLSAQVTDAAERIAVPTLLIAGENDLIAPVEGQRRALERFPDARLVVVPKVGHLIHYETPDAAASAITEFLDGLA